MEVAIEDKGRNEKKKSTVLTVLIFLFMLVGIMIPIFRYQVPPPELEGVLVSFGNPNAGQDNEAAQPATSTPAAAVIQSEEETAEEIKESKAPEKLTDRQEEEVVVSQEEEGDESEALEAQREENERKAAEEAARRQAEAEAKAEAEAEKQRQYEASKSEFSELLAGSGRGENNQSDNQGDPEGDPNAANLSGIASGSGRVGGGLANRAVVYEPSVSDQSQKTGKVVMKVCVDRSGKVKNATYTQRGSTTGDQQLVDIARRSALQYQFTESEAEEQCGVITFEFIVE